MRCDGRHEHIQLVGGRAKRAEEYPDKLCRRRCKGLRDHLRVQSESVRTLGEIVEVIASRGYLHEEEESGQEFPQEQVDGEGRDCSQAECGEDNVLGDVTGMALDMERVRKARREEFDYFR